MRLISTRVMFLANVLLVVICKALGYGQYLWIPITVGIAVLLFGMKKR